MNTLTALPDRWRQRRDRWRQARAAQRKLKAERTAAAVANDNPSDPGRRGFVPLLVGATGAAALSGQAVAAGGTVPVLPVVAGGLGNGNGDVTTLSVLVPGGTTALTLSKLVPVDARAFGCQFDGKTDDTVNLRKAITAAIQGGFELVLPPGATVLSAKLGFDGNAIAGAKPFRIRGAGKYLTRFVRGSSYATNAQIEFDNFPLGFETSDFTVDAGYSTYGVNTHGLVVYNSSYVRLRRLHARDYLATGILVFQDAGGTNVDCVGEDCTADGLGVANNGLLMANMIRSGWTNPSAVNCPGSPGIGVQLKNACDFCWIDSPYAEGCTNGIGFGNDITTKCVSDSRVRGAIVKNCQSAFTAGYSYNCDVDIAVVDSADNTVTGYGVDLQSCVSVSVRVGQVKNNAHRVVMLRSGTTDCLVEIVEVNNDQGAGTVCEFQSGSDRNLVRLRKFSLPTTVGAVSTFYVNSGGTGNLFVYDPQAPIAGPGATYVSAQVPDNTPTGGNARGQFSVDLQISRTSASRVASGTQSAILFGANSLASGTGSLAGGDNCQATGLSASAFGGGNNSADGAYSTVFGGNYATTRATYGKGAYASGRFAVQGDAQLGRHCLRAAASGTAATRATSDGAAAGAANSIPMPLKSAFAARVTAVAFDTATYDAAMWTIDNLLASRGASGAPILVGTPTVTKAQASSGASGWSLAVAIDSTNNGLAFTVTGSAGASIHLVLHHEGPEVQ